MPELPEVETIVRTLAPQIVGKKLVAEHLLHAKSLQAGQGLFTSALPGCCISRVFRRAKLLLVELAPPDAGTPLFMVFHLKMTGRFFVHPANTPPLKHTRIIFDLAETQVALALHSRPPAQHDCRLFFDDMRTFGYCRIMRPEELPLWPFWASLGPEPLECSDEALAEHFASRRAGIKAALLDQTVVAGVGNIYADESLFRAGIDPLAKTTFLSNDRLRRLAKELKAVLTLSIEECGSSIRDYRDAKGNAGAFQNSFAVYGRKGEACTVCGHTLSFTRAAGRGTVFCPRCQRD